jgi:hypothetical protein
MLASSTNMLVSMREFSPFHGLHPKIQPQESDFNFTVLIPVQNLAED